MEIEDALLTRVHAISESGPEKADPEYAEGLRTAIAAALRYGLESIESGEKRFLPIPTALLSQARIAARYRISLDTVLRRYFAGYVLLSDFLSQVAAENDLLDVAELKDLQRGLSTVFDRLLAAISEEYSREGQSHRVSSAQRKVRRVEGLLAGELVDTAALGYGLGGCHLGLVASGPGALGAVRELAAGLDWHLLLISPAPELAWAWLGGRKPLDPGWLLAHTEGRWVSDIALAIGEPGKGIAGWRLTHRQAKATMPIARRGVDPVRYAEVALIAAALRDDLLARSLEELYVQPLAKEQDDGAASRRTLHAYFAAARNASSAAAALGVSRQTVNSRLRAIENRIGRSLDSCAAELETALRLQQLSDRQIH